MRHTTIIDRLMAGVAAMLALVLTASVVATWSSYRIRSVGQETVSSSELVRLSDEVELINHQIFAAEQGMILGGVLGDKAMLDAWTEQIQKEIAAGHAVTKQLHDRLANTPGQQIAVNLQAKMGAWEARCDACHEFASEIRTSPQKVLAFSTSGEALMSQGRDLAQQVKKSAAADFEAQAASSSSTYTGARGAIALTLLLSLGVGAAVFVVIRKAAGRMRHVAGGLRDGTTTLGATAGQVGQFARDLSEGVLQEAASLEETSASMEELTSTTRQNAERASQARDLMLEAEKEVTLSNAALVEMTEAMSRIRHASAKMSDIMKTIDQIAFQTNLLALNAAVEAARAGDAGLGFAVVADEVRALAQRAQQAARDTSTLIEESLASTDAGAGKVQSVSSAIGAVTERVGKVRVLVEEVTAASGEQRLGFEQVVKAVSGLEQQSQRTAALAEEGSGVSEELRAQTESTVSLAAELEGMVGSSKPKSKSGRVSADDAAQPDAAAADPAPVRPRRAA